MASLSDLDVSDDMQLDYEEACNDVVELQQELRALQMEIRQLQLRLQGARAPVVGGPASLPVVGAAFMEERHLQEIRCVLSWLAKHVDLGKQELLEVGFAVPIGGRMVHLQTVVQWPLASAPSGKLRISAPVEHHFTISTLLASIQKDGQVDQQALQTFAAAWELVPGDICIPVSGKVEPSMLLAHRGSRQGVLVSTWPSREALQTFHVQITNRIVLSIGERVTVQFNGRWYLGTLVSVDATGKASVKCDVDAPGVFTVTPLCCVRPLLEPRKRDGRGDATARELKVELPMGTSEHPTKEANPGKPLLITGHRRTRSSAL